MLRVGVQRAPLLPGVTARQALVTDEDLVVVTGLVVSVMMW